MPYCANSNNIVNATLKTRYKPNQIYENFTNHVSLCDCGEDKQFISYVTTVAPISHQTSISHRIPIPNLIKYFQVP